MEGVMTPDEFDTLLDESIAAEKEVYREEYEKIKDREDSPNKQQMIAILRYMVSRQQASLSLKRGRDEEGKEAGRA